MRLNNNTPHCLLLRLLQKRLITRLGLLALAKVSKDSLRLLIRVNSLGLLGRDERLVHFGHGIHGRAENVSEA